jgi:hypothetical protein
MEANKYEKTYVSVENALRNVEYVEPVVEFLRKQTSPVSCKEIGTAVFGPEYSRHKTYPARMGQILRHLRQGNFIKMEKRDGDPIEIEVEDYVPCEDENGEPLMLIVHDDKGREYRIDNPNYRGGRRYHWATVKKTITPTIKIYTWVAD